MTEDTQAAGSRLTQLIDLVDREDEHLLGVRERLLGDDCAVDAERVEGIVASDTGIDRLESFGAKCSRMQDTIVDKLVPALLRELGERPAAAIDNLQRLERLELIDSAEAWVDMRWLRNRLVHEYIDRPADLAAALERACRFTDDMHAGYQAMRAYAAKHRLVSLPGHR